MDKKKDDMRVVTTAEVILLTGISRRKIRRLVETGKLNEVPLGFREKHFLLSDVRNLLRPLATNSDHHNNN